MERTTHSKRRDFMFCPRLYYWRHERRLDSKIRRPGFRRGAAFGDALFAAAQRPGEEAAAVSESVDASYAEIHPSTQEQADELELEKVKLLPIALGYIGRYGLQRGRREVTFDLPLINPATGRTSHTFRRAGKIDGLRAIGENRYQIVEDKLVGQIQRAMIERLPLDAQVSEYVDALLEVGAEAEVSYRHTLFPQSKPALFGAGANRRRESLEEYGERLAQDIAERPEHYYDEQVLQFPTDRLDDYRRGRWGTVRKLMDARLLAKHVGWQEAYPQFPTRCYEYGGCTYLPLCTRGEEAMDLYEEVPDNVELRKEPDGEEQE